MTRFQLNHHFNSPPICPACEKDLNPQATRIYAHDIDFPVLVCAACDALPRFKLAAMVDTYLACVDARDCASFCGARVATRLASLRLRGRKTASEVLDAMSDHQRHELAAETIARSHLPDPPASAADSPARSRCD